MEQVLKPNVVLSVVRSNQQEWHVMAEDISEPLASFTDPQAACAWAVERATPLNGRVLVEEITAPGAAANREVKYSIPVSSSDSGSRRPPTRVSREPAGRRQPAPPTPRIDGPLTGQ
jgi:hypothetical protein